ncbi:sodium:solute symporter [Pedobacter nanyangensis]|uniref:sodium:solute symporter n=1 Tax=Pedobacter nanyangensis TaxID=1562389 RepID=UPI000DE1ACC5|nr:sodium:solute symporter [Pedobacter nanyangensis]
MSSTLLLCFLIGYFGVLIAIAFATSKNSSDNSTFFLANKNSKWYLVAFGMIGTALSGVTFISVPGEVGAPAGNQFQYFQFVLGNAVGFIIIATVLLPLYYRMNLTSIYSYIEQRLGYYSYKTAAFIFLVSRTLGSATRLYLVVIVLQRFIFDTYGVPFWVTVLISLGLIWSYTFKGGLKTIIITDTLQTFFLVLSVFLTIYFICDSLSLSIPEAFETVKNSSYSKIFFFEDFLTSKFYFSKQFIGGIFVTIAMTGLDQDLMQKNLSMKTIGEAQKNMFTFTGIFVVLNIFFLSVGALLYIFAAKNGIEIPLDHVTGKPRTDLLFPEIALNHLSTIPAIVFMLGLTAATFATTDSALTALTTSFCVDFLGMGKTDMLNQTDIKDTADKLGKNEEEFSKVMNDLNKKAVKKRHTVHITFSLIMFFVILAINALNSSSVVSLIFLIASYTYGPLLGLYSFGLFVKSRGLHDKLVPWVCVISPILCYFFATNAEKLLGGYVFSVELILINGFITFMGLLLISKKTDQQTRF